MNLLWLAMKNLRHYGRSYAPFFLSSTFAVWMFYLYGSLVLHPDLARQMNEAGRSGLGTVQVWLTALEVLVALFSAFFIRFSHSAFIRARQAEMGMLTLLGMEARQQQRMIFSEALGIGTAAIALGVALGAVFSKLFYLAISPVLKLEPLPFHFSWKAALITLPVFAALFSFSAWTSGRSLRRLAVAEVLRMAVKPKEPPRFSLWLVALCAACLGTAYWLAATVSAETAGSRSQPILLLLVVGTYLLFTQVGVGTLRLLTRRRELYCRRTNMLTIAQMAYKVRDNATVLFMAAVLGSVALSAAGMAYGGLYMATERAEAKVAADLTLVGAPGGVNAARLEAMLKEHGQEVSRSFVVPALKTGPVPVSVTADLVRELSLAVVPLQSFNEWWTFLGHAPLLEPTLVVPYDKWSDRVSAQVTPDLKVDVPRLTDSVFETAGVYEGALVVDQATFDQVAARLETTPIYLYMLRDWPTSEAASIAILREIQQQLGPVNWAFGFISKAILRGNMIRGDSFLLFVAGFLGLLFLLAACNMLYFRIFTDLPDDQRQFRALFKIGLTAGEMRRIISVQTLTLFAVPLAVALINGAIAVSLFGRQFEVGLLKPAAPIPAIFAAVFLAYGLVTRRSYVGALTERTQP